MSRGCYVVQSEMPEGHVPPSTSMATPDEAKKFGIAVKCKNAACPERGKRHRVRLSLIAPGVVAKPSLLCAECFHELAVAAADLAAKTGQ